MTSTVRLPRRFAVLYGITGLWGVLGGGALLLAARQPLFGAILIAGGVVFAIILIDGRLIRERAYATPDLISLGLPVLGILALGGIALFTYPGAVGVVVYIIGFLLLSGLCLLEALSATRRTKG
jgi:hypothetical protein